ncbi:Abi family protein [Listeria booriae]|uniref:Abi family protein n=1 Tax=Listeria booriae TaxID=1552123 RepID=A0A7X0XQP5_9LIST|nr:Abi family protein [Listeria booriae]MBC1778809.1 Abi family protein [Listeria booriae]
MVNNHRKYKADKPFLPVEDQIEKLIGRGLSIGSKEKAKQLIMTHNYYNIINGYKDIFLKSSFEGDDRYIEGSTFEDLYELYMFDRDLRKTILAVTIDVECTFYTNVAYFIGKEYGHEPQKYLDKSKYNTGHKQNNGKTQRENLLDMLWKNIHRPRIEPLIYYKNNYKNMPPWILTKGLTFGQVYTLFELSKSEIKEEIIKSILGIDYVDEKLKEFFAKMMSIFIRYRNWSAHGGRMYNHRCKPELTFWEPLFTMFGVTKSEFNKGRGKNDLLALTASVMFFYQSNTGSTIDYFVFLNSNMDKYRDKRVATYSKVITETGLPENTHEKFLNFISDGAQNKFTLSYLTKESAVVIE